MKDLALLRSVLRDSVSQLESCLTTASRMRCLDSEDHQVLNEYRRYLKSELDPACLAVRFAIRQIEFATQLALYETSEKSQQS